MLLIILVKLVKTGCVTGDFGGNRFSDEDGFGLGRRVLRGIG
jgi:hypothetical protein